MTKIKICGVRTVGDARAVAAAGADFIGVVLSPSPRRAALSELEAIVAAIGAQVSSVGVFSSVDNLTSFDRTCDVTLDYYQVYFDYAGVSVRQPKRGWIRSFMMTNADGVPTDDSSELLLYDFKNVGVPASADKISVPERITRTKIFIAGDLRPDNVATIVKAYRPFGVDAARGTEKSPGVKDMSKVEQFVRSVRNA